MIICIGSLHFMIKIVYIGNLNMGSCTHVAPLMKSSPPPHPNGMSYLDIIKLRCQFTWPSR